MSLESIVITYVSVLFVLLAAIFIGVAVSKANSRYTSDGGAELYSFLTLLWPLLLCMALIAACLFLITWPLIAANDALAMYIRRKK